MSDVLTFENPVFTQFAFYGSLLVGKTVLMGPLTTYFRLKHETYSNPEDLALSKTPGLKVKFDDETVERIRRAHQNDLENILPFTIIGMFFVATEPFPHVAKHLFRTFVVARFVHSFTYLLGLPTRIRTMAFVVGTGVNMLMVMRVFLYSRFIWD